MVKARRYGSKEGVLGQTRHFLDAKTGVEYGQTAAMIWLTCFALSTFEKPVVKIFFTLSLFLTIN